MTRTGKFATEDQAKEIQELAAHAQRTPVIAFSMQHGIEKGGLAGEAWDAVYKTTHKYALANGLPEITGYYGIDLSNREFVTT